MTYVTLFLLQFLIILQISSSTPFRPQSIRHRFHTKSQRILRDFIISSHALYGYNNLANAADNNERTILVTGSTDGIGKHTAMKIANQNGNLIIHGRNPLKLDKTVKEIKSLYPKATIYSYCYDLSDMTNVKSFASEIIKNHNRLDCLINNAGIYTDKFITTRDHMESTFAVNVAAPYLLSLQLLPLLSKTSKSRIVNVASTSQEEGDPHINLNNLQFQKSVYEGHAAYSISKLCMAAMSYEMTLKVKPEDTLIFSCDPNIAVNTKMLRDGWGWYDGPIVKLDDADDEFHLATDLWNRNMHGKYYVNLKEAQCNPEVYNAQLREGLWTELSIMTGAAL